MVLTIIANRKIFTEKIFFNGFDTFLAQFFSFTVNAFFYSLGRRKMLSSLRSMYMKIQGLKLPDPSFYRE